MAERTGPRLDLMLAREPVDLLRASAKRSMPDAPIGSDDSTPPEQLTGMSPSIEVAPLSVSFQPAPTSANPRFSIHIGSYQLNGT